MSDKRNSLLLALFLTPLLSIAQLTIKVVSIPDNTPMPATIYIAGNFNNWDPGNDNYRLTNTGGEHYEITFTPATGNLEFKFTRGSWATVEGTANGTFIPNRQLNYTGGAQTAELSIAGWEDNGGGVPEAAIDLLFHPFFTTKDVGKGTGLGLSVSFGIVEAMGGKIDVRNEGDGACFEVTLPIVSFDASDADQTEYEPEEHPGGDTGLNAETRQNIRILVVDDEVDAMEIISGYLEAQGYNVSAASDGEDALALAAVVQPNILITDIRMPQMDGNALVKELRSRDPALPVIVMTGHPGDAERPVDDDGADAPVMVMSKPLNLKELLGILDELSEVCIQ